MAIVHGSLAQLAGHSTAGLGAGHDGRRIQKTQVASHGRERRGFFLVNKMRELPAHSRDHAAAQRRYADAGHRADW